MAAKSASGAPTGRGKCLRPFDAIRTYSRSTGDSSVGGTSTRRTRWAPPWEITASPCAASMLCTQSEIVPNIETMYRSTTPLGNNSFGDVSSKGRLFALDWDSRVEGVPEFYFSGVSTQMRSRATGHVGVADASGWISKTKRAAGPW